MGIGRSVSWMESAWTDVRWISYLLNNEFRMNRIVYRMMAIL